MPLTDATMNYLPDLAGFVITLDAHPSGTLALLCLVLVVGSWWRKGQ